MTKHHQYYEDETASINDRVVTVTDTRLHQVVDSEYSVDVFHEHKHLCGRCGMCWKHTDRVMETVTETEHYQAHHCPNCGTEQYDKYFTARDNEKLDEAQEAREFYDSIMAIALSPRQEALLKAVAGQFDH